MHVMPAMHAGTTATRRRQMGPQEPKGGLAGAEQQRLTRLLFLGERGWPLPRNQAVRHPQLRQHRRPGRNCKTTSGHRSRPTSTTAGPTTCADAHARERTHPHTHTHTRESTREHAHTVGCAHAHARARKHARTQSEQSRVEPKLSNTVAAIITMTATVTRHPPFPF